MQNKYNQKISTDGKILMEGQKMLFFTAIDELPPIDSDISGLFHTHNCISLEFLISGKAINRMNNTEEVLLPGSMLMLSQFDFHQIYIPEKSSFIYFEFDDCMASSETLKLWGADKPAISTRFTGADFSYIIGICEELLREYDKLDFGNEEAISGLLSYLMVKILRSSKKTNNELKSFEDKTGILSVITYIRHHFREKLTLAELANVVNLNSDYLCRNFHKYVGMSFRYYLQSVRLNFAMSLVRMTDLSVAEICHECGFESVPHFSTAFKKMFGHSPSHFRP